MDSLVRALAFARFVFFAAISVDQAGSSPVSSDCCPDPVDIEALSLGCTRFAPPWIVIVPLLLWLRVTMDKVKERQYLVVGPKQEDRTY